MERLPVWLLMARCTGRHPVELARLMSCLNFSTHSFRHSSRPWIADRCSAVRPCHNNHTYSLSHCKTITTTIHTASSALSDHHNNHTHTASSALSDHHNNHTHSFISTVRPSQQPHTQLHQRCQTITTTTHTASSPLSDPATTI